jgi:hypothetical protein
VDASSAADLDNKQRRLTCFAGATVVWIAIDYTAAGLAAVADQPRAGAAAAVRLSYCAQYPPMYCAGMVYAGNSAAVLRCCTLHIICPGYLMPNPGLEFPRVTQRALWSSFLISCALGQRHSAAGAAHSYADGRLRRRSGRCGCCGGTAAGRRARRPAAGRQARQGAVAVTLLHASITHAMCRLPRLRWTWSR